MRFTYLLFLLAACAPVVEDAKDPAETDLPDTDETADTDPMVDTDPVDVPTDLSCATGDLGNTLGSRVVDESNASQMDAFQLSCAPSTGGLDLALTWTARATGCFQFSTEGSAIDTVLAVYEHCASRELVCNDDLEPGLGVSRVTTRVDVGESRLVVIDGYDDSAVGNVVMHLLQFPVLAADVDGGSAEGAVASGSNVGADNTMDPLQCAMRTGGDVVVRWVAPAAATYTFSTTGTTYDASISLHTECGLDPLVCASAPGGVGSVSYELQQGEVVFVRIGASKSDAGDVQTGDWALDITR